jgi:hypothetical protein
MNALVRGVDKHGRFWKTIKRDGDFAALLRDFSNDAMKHKWKEMIRTGQVQPPPPPQGSVQGTGASEIITAGAAGMSRQ